jgi:hypothetical protein
VANYWEDQSQDYDWQRTRIRDRDRWEIVLAAAIIFGSAAVIAALTKALRDDNGWGAAVFPLASLSGVLSVASGGWWLVDRHKKSEANRSRILTVLATLGLGPLLVILLLMMPKGSQSTLVALDAKTGRQLWRVHPQAIWLGRRRRLGQRVHVQNGLRGGTVPPDVQPPERPTAIAAINRLRPIPAPTDHGRRRPKPRPPKTPTLVSPDTDRFRAKHHHNGDRPRRRVRRRGRATRP